MYRIQKTLIRHGPALPKEIGFVAGPSYNHLSVALAYRDGKWLSLGQHVLPFHSLVNVRSELNEDKLSAFEESLPHISLSKMLLLTVRGEGHFDLE